MKLFLEYTPTSYPYADTDNNENLGDWGNIKLICISNKQTFQLFSINWHLSPLLEWLNKNESKIKSEEFFYGDSALSLSKRVEAARKVMQIEVFDEEESEKWRNKIFEFYDSHCIRMAFRGVDVPEIFIGINGKKQEVSLDDFEQDIRLYVDLADFFDAVAKINWQQKNNR